jgi:hypothetical protein
MSYVDINGGPGSLQLKISCSPLFLAVYEWLALKNDSMSRLKTDHVFHNSSTYF